MSREIKFLAYGHLEDEDYKVHEVTGFESFHGCLMPIHNGIPICDHSLMQFIGRVDKNGVGLYEGYIIEYEMSDSRKGGRYTLCTGKIQWNIDEACFEVIDLDTGNGFDCDFVHTSKLIGNIYEHSNLLE